MRAPLRLPLRTPLAAIALYTASASMAAQSPPDLRDGLAVSRPAAAALDSARLARIAPAMRTDSFPKTTSILIVRHGSLAYEGYFNAGTLDLLNDTRSATKSVTSLAVGAAIADGRISSVTAPAFAFLADQRPFAHDGPAKEAITVQDFLTMSSALDCDDNVDTSPGNEESMYPESTWTRWAVALPLDSTWRRDSTGLGPWRYCTAGVFLLGQIVQRAVSDSVNRYVQRRLLEPLGISRWEWSRSPAGEVMTGGGLRLRSRDLAKLALMVLHDGHWGAEQVVPREWITQALSVRRAANGGLGYGYLFWERDYKTPCGSSRGWFMTGNGGNAIVMLKDLDAVVVITRQDYGHRGMHRVTQALLEDYVLPAFAPTICSQ